MTAFAGVTYNDGTKKTFPLSYETLFRPGDIINMIGTDPLVEEANMWMKKELSGLYLLSSFFWCLLLLS
ncbi:hypothetical protein [Paenibacillus sp. FSL H7-0331]|uniref:hypothetical protein n=1 Tax=Paenibacillus sp. FSL H7-0331 TaxID=1920421 RepID=UPI0015C3C6DC|nr:hypothetical protein [Paenibacillus sp. FSL H7-0331]